MNEYHTNTRQMTTLVSVLTPPGRGAAAAVSLCGDLAELEHSARQQQLPFFEARNGRSLASQVLNRICYGTWQQEALVACRVAEDRVEIYPHGGTQAVRRVVQDLVAAGAEEVPWQQQLEETA